MAKSRRAVRLGGIIAACALSVGLGLALVFRFVTAETVSRINTIELLAMVGLLVLPGLSAWAVHVERKFARARVDAGAERPEEAPAPRNDAAEGTEGIEGITAAEAPIVVQTPSEGSRRGRRADSGRRRSAVLVHAAVKSINPAE